MAKKKRARTVVTPEGVDISEWDVPATKETKAKHRKTSFERMIEKNEVTGPMLDAAREIERVYFTATRQLWAKSPCMERISGSRQSDIPLRVAWALKVNYKPWADELSRRSKRGGPKALETVISVVIDGWTVSEIDDARRWGHGFAKFIVRRALLEYAVMARWVPMRELTEFDARNGEFARRAA